MLWYVGQDFRREAYQAFKNEASEEWPVHQTWIEPSPQPESSEEQEIQWTRVQQEDGTSVAMILWD